MGFKVPKRTAVLEFDEASGFQGAEIRCRLDITTEAFFELQRLRDRQEEAPDSERIRQTLEFFLNNIVLGWNLEDEDTGEAIPVTIDAAMTMLPPRLTVGLVPMWMEIAIGVPAPLSEPSSSDSSSQEESTQQLAELSESLSS